MREKISMFGKSCPIPVAGDLVQIGPAYRGGGAYAPDGAEGWYTVLGVTHDTYGCDMWLVRGDVRADLPSRGEWEICVSVTRIAEIREGAAAA